MKTQILAHLLRVWTRHGTLQVAAVAIMASVLVIMNFVVLTQQAVQRLAETWGTGLEMTVYLKDEASSEELESLRRLASDKSSPFSSVEYVSKDSATQKFLSTLGQQSLDLMSDPKWRSPIPASLEMRLRDEIAPDIRINVLTSTAERFRALPGVDDVFFGQGWIENFQQFIVSANALVVAIWLLTFTLGAMIVGGVIRMSFMQRHNEIAVLELVGATKSFIRTPFLVEGLIIGTLAALVSILVSGVVHAMLLGWLAQGLSFWDGLRLVEPMPWSLVILNVLSAISFGVFGAWHSIRRLNTGWAALVS
jgi:cell division transport system permease protein